MGLWGTHHHNNRRAIFILKSSGEIHLDTLLQNYAISIEDF